MNALTPLLHGPDAEDCVVLLAVCVLHRCAPLCDSLLLISVIETTVLFVIIKVMQSVVSVCSFVATVAFESTDLRN